jgi:hypothetical protein
LKAKKKSLIGQREKTSEAPTEQGKPMNATKKSDQAAGEKTIHKHEAALVLDVGQFEFRTRDRFAPGVILHFLNGERSEFNTASQTHRGAEENAEHTAKD